MPSCLPALTSLNPTSDGFPAQARPCPFAELASLFLLARSSLFCLGSYWHNVSPNRLQHLFAQPSALAEPRCACRRALPSREAAPLPTTRRERLANIFVLVVLASELSRTALRAPLREQSRAAPPPHSSPAHVPPDRACRSSCVAALEGAEKINHDSSGMESAPAGGLVRLSFGGVKAFVTAVVGTEVVRCPSRRGKTQPHRARAVCRERE